MSDNGYTEILNAQLKSFESFLRQLVELSNNQTATEAEQGTQS